jgi:FkbM family methyltransferase
VSLIDGALSHRTPAGKAIRLPLRLLPAGAVVPIVSGPAAGLKWILGSGPHSCWLGINERRKRRMLAALLRPGAVFFDVGANVGSFTLLAARLVGDGGRVVAFEPVPANVRFLQRHLNLNRFTNVDVFQLAAAAQAGSVRFETTSDRLRGHIADHGQTRVASVSIDQLVAEGAVPLPSCIKIDVEGGELDVLRGGRQVITRAMPHLFVATHSDRLRAECSQLLEGIGYRIEKIDGPWELFAAPRGRS